MGGFVAALRGGSQAVGEGVADVIRHPMTVGFCLPYSICNIPSEACGIINLESVISNRPYH